MENIIKLKDGNYHIYKKYCNNEKALTEALKLNKITKTYIKKNKEGITLYTKKMMII